MKRPIHSFEAKPEVLAVIKRTRNHGIKFSHVANTAIREWAARNGWLHKRDVPKGASV